MLFAAVSGLTVPVSTLPHNDQAIASLRTSSALATGALFLTRNAPRAAPQFSSPPASLASRHLDNLLLTRNGELFHIDFGYILGRDPKPYPPPMKLTKDMIEAMGGPNSEDTRRFRCVLKGRGSLGFSGRHTWTLTAPFSSVQR